MSTAKGPKEHSDSLASRTRAQGPARLGMLRYPELGLEGLSSQGPGTAPASTR